MIGLAAGGFALKRTGQLYASRTQKKRQEAREFGIVFSIVSSKAAGVPVPDTEILRFDVLWPLSGMLWMATGSDAAVTRPPDCAALSLTTSGHASWLRGNVTGFGPDLPNWWVFWRFIDSTNECSPLICS